MVEIYVCHAGSCRGKGAEAVLLEIEELANAVDGNCTVRASGCLGMCRQAPTALVVKREHRGGAPQQQREIEHTRIRSMEASAAVVVSATGKQPPLDDPEISERLSGVRSQRVREHACSVYRWNTALHALAEQITKGASKAGQELVNHLRVLYSKAGFTDCVPSSSAMPCAIENYTQWSLERVTQVSKHSAVFHLVSKDRKRATPHPRGNSRLVQPKTWHTTLLAEVGPNEEGPLPWIERDYTPISSAKEWETGKCDILIKIYNNGAATSWLHRVVTQSQAIAEPSLLVWLSQPVQTLRVPSLMPDESMPFFPASVLMLLAGTGVVALPQILHHRDPIRKLGFATHSRNRLQVPVDLMLSCRADDVLMLPQITQWCQEACDLAQSSPEAAITSGVRNCTLLLSDAITSPETPPFPDVTVSEAELEKLQQLPNACVLNARLSLELLSDALSKMPMPCRVVVSGPSSYNAAAREMLTKLSVQDEAITILNS